MAIIWSVSPTPACPLRVTPVWGCSLDTCIACELVGLTVLLHALPGLCHLRWLLVTTVRSSYRLRKTPVNLPRFTVGLTPCYCGVLGGLHVLVGSLTSPSPGRLFEPSSLGRVLCLRLG